MRQRNLLAVERRLLWTRQPVECAGRGAPLACGAVEPLIDGEEAFEALDEGIGRRDLLRAAALVSAGATVPRWLTSPGVAAAAAPEGGEPSVLQSGQGPTTGSYIAS